MSVRHKFVILISADAEWRAIRDYFQNDVIEQSPFGEWFTHDYQSILEFITTVIWIHGGWGKVAAAASAQYVIDRWHPELLINIGTCGGFEGEIENGEIILVEKTIIYDIFEQMGDPDEHIKYYMTDIDTSWITEPYPIPLRRSVLVSGDRDLLSSDLTWLNSKYGAIAGDWESGAIAWIAKKNQTQCLVLRGVTDLVGNKGGEAYTGNISFYQENTKQVMRILINTLPQWFMNYIRHYATNEFTEASDR